MRSATPTEYLDPTCVAAAIATYNQVRTALEEAGWYCAKPSHEADSAYWWVHPGHPGVYSMPAAFRRLAIDESAAASSP